MLLIIISVIFAVLGRAFFVIYSINRSKSQASFKRRSDPAKTAIIMGSGGHTAEMLRLLLHINFENYSPRLYIMADSDTSTETKIIDLENHKSLKKTSHSVHRIPRSRSVNQSYLSSVFSTLHSLLFALPLLFREKPDLILCNGPGTCVPICVIAFIMRILWLCDCKIIYIESICRVKSLSLTGKILLYFVDEFFVQWEDLQKSYKNTRYIGCLV